MKCPKCQNEINGNAKFCIKCGCNIAEAMANANQAMKPVQQVQKSVCVKCGAELMPGARFCTKCGTPVEAKPAAPTTPVTPVAPTTPVTPVPQAKPVAPTTPATPTTPVTPVPQARPISPTPSAPQNDDEKTLFLFGNDTGVDSSRTVHIDNTGNGANVTGNQYGNIVGTPNQMNYQQNIPQPGNIVPPENNGKKKVKKQKDSKQLQEPEKAGAGLIIAAVILGVLVIASGVICFLVWNGTFSLPFIDGNTKQVSEESTEEETESSSEDETTAAVNADELFTEEDTLITTGKSQIATDAEIVNGMNTLTTAINQSVAKAEEAGDAALAADRVTDAYASYVTAVNKHKDMLNGSTLSGGIYGQIMMELEDAIALGEELIAKGYAVDTSSLTSARDEFDKTYTEKIISTFDEFTSRATWSRTESWNLMSETADNMFDSSDLDNPIRLRYAYALSWWTQKQIETEIANGTITGKGAAIKIANLIDVMDYNPMMIDYYITYMKEAGEDCTEVESAYNDIVDHIAETQGLRIGVDVALDHFWYFNDFITHPVDATNGVTQENRQWIRDRMSSVTFLKQ